MFSSIYLIYGVTFLAALLLVEGLYHLFTGSRSGRDAVNRRMRLIEDGATSREVFQSLRRKPLKQANLLGSFGKFGGKLDHLIEQSGLTITMSRVIAMMCALTIGTFLTITVLTSSGIIVGGLVGILVVFALSFIVGIVVPIFFLQYKKSKRLSLFAKQLPDALDIMVRSLKAGHPISTSMTMVTKEMSDPIGTEFGIAVDEMTYGLELREALANLGNRVDVEDYQYVVVSINIQHETGGNLAEVLQNLSTVLRARFRMFKKIRAISAEGRLSAKILAIMPFAFGALTFTKKPDYYLNVVEDPLFWPLVAVALLLELAGIWIMYKLVNFRV